MLRSALIGAFALTSAVSAAEPIRLHPDNPRYFQFRGKPTILITSAEHYGAVLNRDFRYLPYLDALQAAGFNLTRTFSGTYREVPGTFGITENTLAPAAASFACPWARSATPGAGDGGNKFDLTKWDAEYFDRLKDFLTQAGKRGVVVEFVLFCTLYEDKLWDVSPMKASNNVNGIGNVGREQVYTLKEKELVALHGAFVRKVVAELKDFDNVYFEICNEPYFAGVAMDWSDHIAETIAAAEADLPGRHLIAQNIANGSAAVAKPNPRVSIFNFHYATPPDTVKQNVGLKRPIADDETGFRGTSDLPYRVEGWEFLIAGGAVYSNLDYSFTLKHPDGTAEVTTSPGGGGPALRKQLGILKDFLYGFDFVRMTPDNSVVKGGSATVALAGSPAEGRVTIRAMVEKGKAYAIYIRGGTAAEPVIDLPAGSYKADWVNTRTGTVDKAEDFPHPGGRRALVSPPYSEDIALRIRRIERGM